MILPDVNLTFKNESNDANNSEIVIFQKNIASNNSEMPIAWKVIKNCGPGWKHPFIVPYTRQVGATDAWGNTAINPLPAKGGQLFHVFQTNGGSSIKYAGQGPNWANIGIRNDLPKGIITTEIYSDGRLLAHKVGIAPGQKAVFNFNPIIWIGIASQIREGQPLNSYVLANTNTKFGVLGIFSADIIMTGGGIGPDATPFEFHLENVIF